MNQSISRKPLLIYLNKEINILRDSLNRVGARVDNLSDPNLVRLSQLLDRKLNMYQELLITIEETDKIAL